MPASADRAVRPRIVLRDLRQMLGIFGTIVVAAIAVGVFAEPVSGAGSTLVGSAAPDIVAMDVDGEPFRLADLRGRPVWLNFFSSWCVRCRAENPDIDAVHHEQEASGGVAIVGIGVGESVESAGDYARNAGLTFPIAADPLRSASRRYAVLALPTHVFIDRSGVVREIRVGALAPETMRELVARIEAVSMDRMYILRASTRDAGATAGDTTLARRMDPPAPAPFLRSVGADR